MVFYFFIAIIFHAVVQEYLLDVRTASKEEDRINDSACLEIRGNLKVILAALSFSRLFFTDLLCLSPEIVSDVFVCCIPCFCSCDTPSRLTVAELRSQPLWLRSHNLSLVPQKVIRRLHLSKSKNTKFNESGQLCVFHLVSSVWSFYILITVSDFFKKNKSKEPAHISVHSSLFSCNAFPWFLWQEGYILHPSSLWENYPHVHLRYDCWPQIWVKI